MYYVGAGAHALLKYVKVEASSSNLEIMFAILIYYTCTSEDLNERPGVTSM